MLGDAALANKFAARMLDKGIYVVGFSYPVSFCVTSVCTRHAQRATMLHDHVVAVHTPDQE